MAWDLHAAHRASANHRDEVLASDPCGCFYCRRTFGPEEIRVWTDDGRTAVCPRCGIDAVLGSASGWPMTHEFLQAMHEAWFPQGMTLPRDMACMPPPPQPELEAMLATAVSTLHPVHRQLFARLRVQPRLVPVAAATGGYVWVVAEHDGRLLYYSDVEEGWALAPADGAGGIAERDSNQFDLSMLMWRLFGNPEQRLG